MKQKNGVTKEKKDFMNKMKGCIRKKSQLFAVITVRKRLLQIYTRL